MHISSLLVFIVAASMVVAQAQRGRTRGRGRRPIRGGTSTEPGTGAAIPSGTTASNGTEGGTAGEAGGTQDPQTSLTLDPGVIAKGFANDGQNPPKAGQVASLTSTNNFINFCLTVPDLPITDGKQIQAGSCNPVPIGVIPPVDKMPSSKFVFPTNGATIQAATAFTIPMEIKNIQTGNFVNAQTNYFAAPQQLNGENIIIGHTHFVVQNLTSLDQTEPTDPTQFNFFKGVNGIVSEPVAIGLPAGFYRLCSINTSANHAPVMVPVEQHGYLDDCVYFTATPDGQAAPANAAGAANNDNGNVGA